MNILHRHEYIFMEEVIDVRKLFARLERGEFNLQALSKAAYIIHCADMPLSYAIVLDICLKEGEYHLRTLNLDPDHYMLIHDVMRPNDTVFIGANVLTMTEYWKFAGKVSVFDD